MRSWHFSKMYDLISKIQVQSNKFDVYKGLESLKTVK